MIVSIETVCSLILTLLGAGFFPMDSITRRNVPITLH